jgi:hypothetical protein
MLAVLPLASAISCRERTMTRRTNNLMLICVLTVLSGCASIDSQVAQDLRHKLIDSNEIGYGVGQGAEVDVLGKISDQDKIDHIVGMLEFAGESELSSKEPFDRFMFFMNKDKTMTTLRFDGDKVRYQNKEYTLDEKARNFLNKYYQ